MADAEGRRIVSPDQVAEMLEVPVEVIYDALHRGHLPAYQYGRSYRIPYPHAVEEYFRRCGEHAAAS